MTDLTEEEKKLIISLLKNFPTNLIVGNLEYAALIYKQTEIIIQKLQEK